jgi:hypothetical protein
VCLTTWHTGKCSWSDRYRLGRTCRDIELDPKSNGETQKGFKQGAEGDDKPIFPVRSRWN